MISAEASHRRPAKVGVVGSDVRMGGVTRTPNIFKFARKWDKVSLAAGELTTALSETFFFLVSIIGQLVKTPPQRKVSRHITGCRGGVTPPFFTQTVGNHSACR